MSLKQKRELRDAIIMVVAFISFFVGAIAIYFGLLHISSGPLTHDQNKMYYLILSLVGGGAISLLILIITKHGSRPYRWKQIQIGESNEYSIIEYVHKVSPCCSNCCWYTYELYLNVSYNKFISTFSNVCENVRVCKTEKTIRINW